MLRRILVVTSVLLACGVLWTQSTPPPAATGKSPKTKKSKPRAPVATEFSEEIAKRVLGQIRDGLEGHNPQRMLTAFDPDRMDGYLGMEDRVYAYFDRYENFRVFFRILQSSTDSDRGMALAEWQIEAIPRSGLPRRREGQVRFEFAGGKNGWRIVDFTPRDFFQ
jgi:hypothetical protein